MLRKSDTDVDLPTDAAVKAVEARGVVKRFGSFTAVDGIDLEVPQGVCFGLLGPNGAGKTTLIRMVQCVSPLTEGSLRVLGHDTSRARRRIKARLGVVPQEDNLDPDFTVRMNLTVYARFFGIDPETAGRRADDLLRFMQLEAKRDAKIQELSGGMKRRLIVARSLMNDPDILVLDEPTTGLDPQARHTIWDKIRALRQQGKTILLTTHYMDEAEALCDRLVIIDQGRILSQGVPRELVREHTGGEALEIVVDYAHREHLDAITAELGADGVPFETLPERLIAFGNMVPALQDRYSTDPRVAETVQRRATLEDVFLRLTGRALRD